VKIVLKAKGFMNTINEPNPLDVMPKAPKFATLHFLRHHLHHDLKAVYIMEDMILRNFGTLSRNATINSKA
jgi:hypothetical protein